MLRRLSLALLLLALTFPSQASELSIRLHGKETTIHVAELSRRPDARTIDIPSDVAYHRAMRYIAVPLLHLLPGLRADDHLQFVATDGFAADIPAAALLNHNGSEPWLAVEDPTRPWPRLPGKGASAGPLYVVWLNPRAAGINPEQWPYQLAVIRQLVDATSRFPAMRPATDASASVKHGHQVFQRICLACHTLNGQGDARLGPDLNQPHSPTEYMRAEFLRSYIRDPQSLRHWPQAKMPGFSAQTLSDADLDALLQYLQHMAQRRDRH